MSEHTIQCWSCGTRTTLDEIRTADGYCPECGVEIDLAEYYPKLASDYDALQSRLDAAEQALKASDLRLAQADYNYDMDRNQWRQQLAERDAVLRESCDLVRNIWDASYEYEAAQALEAKRIADRLDALLSSAEPVKPECGCCGRTDRCDDDCDAAVPVQNCIPAKGGDGEVIQ